jgi:arsenate reductase
MKIYHNSRCSKSRQTLELIRKAGVEPIVIDYLSTPPTQSELREICGMLGIDPQDLIRRGESIYQELDLANRELSADEALKVMIENPKLIERPIVVKNQKAVLGRPPENVNRLLD